MCGSVELVASTDGSKLTFEHETLRWDSSISRNDACYHIIKNEAYAFKSGKVFVRFSTIGTDVAIHLNGGKDFRNADIQIIENNSPAAVEYTYSIDQNSYIFIFVNSLSDGSTNTLYKFEYWTEGENWEWYEAIVPLWMTTFDLAGTAETIRNGALLISFGGCAILMCIAACIYCCFRKFARDMGMVVQEPPLATDASLGDEEFKLPKGKDHKELTEEPGMDPENDVQMTEFSGKMDSQAQLEQAGAQTTNIFMGDEPAVIKETRK